MTRYRRAAADAIHNSTKHGSEPAHPERLMNYRRLDPTNAPAPFKRYRGLSVSPLPRHLIRSQPPAVRVLSGERGQPSGHLGASLVATLLFLSAGITRMTEASVGRRIFFRTAMSAGNLHPVEIYLITGPDVDGIAPGVHHFAPREFGLVRLRDGDFRDPLSIEGPLALVLTGLVWRTTWKYGERGWRHLYWDAGTMVANLLEAGAAHGLNPHVCTGFADDTVSELVGIDGIDEVPLALVTLGSGPETAGSGEYPDLAALSLDVAPVARHPVRLSLLIEAQSEGALRSPEVVDWRQAAVAVTSEATTVVDPPSIGGDQTIEEVILQRGSTRLMRHDSVAGEALRWPMAAATRAVPSDITAGGTLLQHYVNVHAVSGRQPGAHRWRGGDLETISERAQARQIGAALCLDQPLGGDSAYTVFHHARLDPILEALGSRGYRAAQLEAGVVSGRLALCAFALGLGATGLTFFDDPVSDYFRTSSAPMLVTSVGVPDTGPAPAGRPGEPVILRRTR